MIMTKTVIIIIIIMTPGFKPFTIIYRPQKFVTFLTPRIGQNAHTLLHSGEFFSHA